jgi:hypothetical protein
VKAGCVFDEWREYFNFDRWMKVFESVGIHPDDYARREIPADEVLPWDHLDVGTSREYLHREYRYCLDAVAERAKGAPEPAAVTPAPEGATAPRLKERHPLESEDY